MNPEDFWQRLQEDWQSASPAVDVVTLTRQVRRKRRRMQLLQALDLILGLVATGVLVKQLYYLHTPHARLLFWVLLSLVWASVVLGAWLRRSTWKPQGTDARSLLQLTVRRARAGLRFVWANLVGLLLVYAAGIPFFWHLFSNGSARGWEKILGMVCLNVGIYALAVAWAIWYGRRQRRKIRRAQAMLRQLEQENGGEDEHL